jgi:hypothetical protein
MFGFKLLTALAALAPAVLAHPATGPRQIRELCAAEPSAEFLADAAAFASLEQYGDNSTRLNIASASEARAAPIVIDTYFHVVARSTSLSGGYVPQSQLTAQFNTLNSNYGE